MKRVALAVVVGVLFVLSPWLLTAFVYPWMRSVSPDEGNFGAVFTCVLIGAALYVGGALCVCWAKDGLDTSMRPPNPIPPPPAFPSRPHGTPPPPPKD